jgi:hypothetical protein
LTDAEGVGVGAGLSPGVREAFDGARGGLPYRERRNGEKKNILGFALQMT